MASIKVFVVILIYKKIPYLTFNCVFSFFFFVVSTFDLIADANGQFKESFLFFLYSFKIQLYSSRTDCYHVTYNYGAPVVATKCFKLHFFIFYFFLSFDCDFFLLSFSVSQQFFLFFNIQLEVIFQQNENIKKIILLTLSCWRALTFGSIKF